MIQVSDSKKLIDGEMHTQESIVEKYTQLVHFCSHKRRRYGASVGYAYEDLVAEGFIGLLKAFARYDESKGFKFTTFAHHYVFGEIQKACNRNNPGINYARKIKEIGHFIRRSELEENPITEIAERLGVKLHHVAYALEYLKNRMPINLDQPVPNSEDDVTLGDIIISQEDKTEIYVELFLESLPDVERIVLLGLMNGDSQRISGERVGMSQIQVSRLRVKLRERYLREYEGIKQ